MSLLTVVLCIAMFMVDYRRLLAILYRFLFSSYSETSIYSPPAQPPLPWLSFDRSCKVFYQVALLLGRMNGCSCKKRHDKTFHPRGPIQQA